MKPAPPAERDKITFADYSARWMKNRDLSHKTRAEYQRAGVAPAEVETGAVIITGETADYVMTYMDMVEKAKAITADLDARYAAFAEAEAYLIENALVIPLSLPVPPYIATRLASSHGIAAVGGYLSAMAALTLLALLLVPRDAP